MSMTPIDHHDHHDQSQLPASNIVDIFSRKTQHDLQQQRIVRISPEYDNLCMLYSNKKITTDKLYTMKILCWGIRANGEVVGMVPWLNKVVICSDLDDPDYGLFEGYYDLSSETPFEQPPAHKVVELETAAHYYQSANSRHALTPTVTTVQEIPDNIGTHAMLMSEDSQTIILTEVLSWQLLSNGNIEAMLIDDSKVLSTPVLPGDQCLYPVSANNQFRYFFQHHIANQIKSEDPDALAAIELLFE